MGGARSGGTTGVNPDSQTVFRNVFTITNKGSQPVAVWFTGESEAVTFIGPDGRSIEGKSGAARLRPGGRSLRVGIVIDSGGVKPGADLLESVTIHTDADAAGVSSTVGSMNDGETGSNPGWNTGKPSTRGSNSCGWDLRCHFDNLVGGHNDSDSPVLGSSGGTSGSVLFVDSVVSQLWERGAEIRTWLREHPLATKIAVEVIKSLLFGTPSSVATERGSNYRPPHLPVNETPITAEAKTHLQRNFTRIGNRRNVEEIIYYVLKHPKVAEDYGEYQLIVGTHPNVDGWIVLWARGDTIVKAGRGGLNRPKTAVGVLQDPIRVTRPDGRTMTVTPADTSLTVHMPEAEEDGTVVGLVAAGILAPLVAAVVVASPADEATAGRYVLDELLEEIDVEDFLDEDDDPPLIPDGGTENRPPGYYALRKQGISEATIEKWHDDGYDLRQMSQALETYRDSPERISSNNGPGDLGEFLAKSEVKEAFPSGIRFESNIKLDGGNNGEFDYVVLNADDEVIGVVEVKHANDRASEAKNDLKFAMRALNENRVNSVSGTLTTENFNVSHDIKRVTIGPSSDEQRIQEDIRERNLPEDSLTRYNKYLNLAQNEIKALAKIINNQ